MWTVPESRPTPESSLSTHFSTASQGNEVISTNYLYVTVSRALYKVEVVRCETQQERSKVKQNQHNCLMSEGALAGSTRA